MALGDRPVARALDVFLVVASPERRDAADAFARRLRDAGVRCDLAAGTRSVKAQFKAADRRDAAAAAFDVAREAYRKILSESFDDSRR